MEFVFKGIHRSFSTDKVESETVTTIHKDVASEVMSEFCYFLSGCGYHPQSVVAALTEVLDEWEDAHGQE